MRVFLAGATGAIGRRLLPQLVAAGYSVTGSTQTQAKATAILSGGATPEVMNALNKEEVFKAVERAQPDVIIHELTGIPARFNLRRFDSAFAVTNRLRTEGTDNLLAAARSVGCRRIIAQSYTGWPYARTGALVKTEEDALMSSPEPAKRKSFGAILHLESKVLGETAFGGVVLRYGAFYGSGTSLGEGGSILEDIRHGRIAMVGKGTGYWSFLHIDDAASATLLAVQAASSGVYNICDDEPAPVSEWLPFLAGVIGAKAPRHIPSWLGRVLIGSHGVAMMNDIRGASNQKAKTQMGWKLRWPSWREGFRDGLGEEAPPAYFRAGISDNEHS